MTRMSAPGMEVVRFKEADVIVASGATMTLSGFADTTAKNGVISTSTGFTYMNDGSMTRNALYSELSAIFGVTVDGYTGMNRPGSTDSNIATVLNADDSGSTKNYNGTYTWDNSANAFVRN